MAGKTWTLTGEVLDYDSSRGVSHVQFLDEVTTMNAIVFHSGRPSGLPSPGDIVRAEVRKDSEGKLLILVARLIYP